MKTVLVTESWFWTTLPVVRNLKRHGLRVLLLGDPSSPRGAEKCPSCDGLFLCPPLEKTEAVVEYVSALIRREHVDVVLPLGDPLVELLADNRARLEPQAALAIPPSKAVAIARDKARTLEQAASLSKELHVPKSYFPRSLDELDSLNLEKMPIVIKPRKSWGGLGIRLVRKREDLRCAYTQVHQRHPWPIVQEYVDYRPGEKYQCLLLFDGGGRLRSWCLHRITHELSAIRTGRNRERIRGGSALMWSSIQNQQLLEMGAGLLSKLDWQGFGFVEFVRDTRTGVYSLMEINPRLSGTVGLPLSQGLDFAYDACRVALGLEIETRSGCRAGVQAKHLLRGLLDAVQNGQPSRLVQILDPRRIDSVPPLAEPLAYLAVLRSLLTA